MSTPKTTAAVLVLAFVAAACAGGASVPSRSPSPTPASATTPVPATTGKPVTTPPALEPTPWQAEILNLEPDGTRSLDSALRLFAMAFGPVPGVSVDATSVGTVDSASPAIRVLRERRDELTDEQREAIDGYLAPGDDDTIIEIPPAGDLDPSPLAMAAVGGFSQGYDPFEREILRIGQQARTAAARYFADIPQFQVRVARGFSGPWLSFFNPTFGPGFEKCEVFVNENGGGGNLGLIGRSIMLDTVHCFQSWKMGSEQGFDGNVPAWAWDGPAEYITLDSWPVQEDDVLYLATYLLLPDVPLFERANDAYVVYAQAFDAGVDLSAAFVAVLTDVDNAERFALAGMTSNVFLDKWASELVRSARGDWGPEWDVVGPGMGVGTNSIRTPQQSMSVAHLTLEAFSQDAYSNHLFALQSVADIVNVQAMGRVRVGDGAVDATVSGSAYFCTTEKGCGPCPDGSEPSIQPVRLATNSILAISGGTDGTNGTVSGHPLEEFCLPSPEACKDPNAPPEADIDRPMAMIGMLQQLPDCPTPKPTDDEFCKRWRALLDWMVQNQGIELTQPWAAEIARRSQDMRPYAPDFLVDDVDLYIRVYGTYATAPEPVNVPIVGPEAAGIANAFVAMNDYCEAPQTPPPTPTPTPPPTPTPSPTPTPPLSQPTQTPV